MKMYLRKTIPDFLHFPPIFLAYMKNKSYFCRKKWNMHKTEGYWNVKPKIKSLSFPKRGKFQVDLIDGRSITMPISAFPSMKKVPVKERYQLCP